MTPQREWTVPIAFSDHDAVILEIRDVNLAKIGRGVWKNNTLVYQQENFQTESENKWQLWQTLHMTLFTDKVKWWLNIKSRIKVLNIKYSKEMTAQSKHKEKELEVNLRELWLRLTDEPELMTTCSFCKKELAQFQKNKIQRKLMKAKYDLMEKGDSGNKAF